MKASLIFFPNTEKKNKRNGKIPIYLRLIYNRQKSEARLNLELSEQDLLKWEPVTQRMQERMSMTNQCLNKYEQRYLEYLAQHATTLVARSALDIKNYVLGQSSERQKSILQFAEEYFVKAVINNVNRRPGTIKNYRRSINHLRNFLTQTKREQLALSDLDNELAGEFYNYLTNSDVLKKRIGMTEVSASGVIKKFRTIYNHAVDQDLLTRNPFKLVKIKTKSPRRERMSIDQVRQLIDLDLGKYPHQQIYRDIYLFSVFTGLAYRDAVDLKWENLECRDSGIIKLSLRRIKTDVFTECMLPEAAISIARKYESCIEQEILGKVLPTRSNKELNSQLKFLAQLSKISITLTSHVARHTFRQLLAESGIEDYGVIKRLMGQSRNGDIDEVYYSVTDSRLMEAKRKFDTYLSVNLKIN